MIQSLFITNSKAVLQARDKYIKKDRHKRPFLIKVIDNYFISILRLLNCNEHPH